MRKSFYAQELQPGRERTTRIAVILGTLLQEVRTLPTASPMYAPRRAMRASLADRSAHVGVALSDCAHCD